MTKEELQEYYWICKNIKKLEYRLLEMEALATKQTTTIKNNADAIVGSRDFDRLGDIVAEIDNLKTQIFSQIRKAYEVLTKIERAIETLPEREKYLIRSRYIERKSWEQIAVDMNYGWAQVHRIHSDALKELA